MQRLLAFHHVVEGMSKVDAAIKTLAAKQKTLAAAVVAAAKRVKVATDQAKPKDLVDIIVSEPIAIRVIPAETK